MKLSNSIIILGFGLAFASISAFADPPLDITVSLGKTTTLRTNDIDTISLAPLAVGDAYQVTCNITDPSNEARASMINVSIMNATASTISVNGQVIGTNSAEKDVLKAVNNTLVIDNLVSSGSEGSLIIKNSSSEPNSSIIVSQCVAKGETSTSKK